MGVVIAATIAALIFPTIAAGIAGNSGTVSVTNETVAAQYDEYVDLDGYAIVTDSETVYAQDGGSWTTVSGTDYTMNYSDGAISVDSGSTVVQDGETIRVSYDYQATNEQSATVLAIVPLMLALLILGVIAAKAMDLM